VTSLSINQLLTLYIWFPLAVLLFFLLMIARFYEKFSGQRTFFRWFFLPIVLFGVMAVRYASINRVAGDMLADAAGALAGIILIGLCANLYRLMTSGRG
jgi:hypothetical protein